MNRRNLIAAAAACAALAAGPATALAAPTLAGEFAVDGTPGRLAVGAGGTAWVSVPGVAHDLARVAPDGTVTHFDLADVPNASGYAGLAVAPDGRIWTAVNGAIVSFAPEDPAGSATKLAIPQLVTADELTFGPGGRLYALGSDGAAARVFIVDVTTPPGVVVNAGGTVVTGVVTPRGIAASSDGLLWVGDFGGSQVVSFNPADGATVAYAVGGGVQDVGAGPAGQVAFTVPNTVLGRVSAGGTPQLTTVAGSDSFGIVLGADGAYWAPGFVSAKAVRMSTDGAVTEPITFSGITPGPRRVAAGPDNTIWYSLEFPGQPAGKVAPPGMTRPAAPRAVRVGRPITVKTTFTQDAALFVRVHRIAPGRRSRAGACVAPSRAPRAARRCARYVRVGAFRTPRAAGTVGVRVGPRIGTRRLGPGRYRIGLRARSAAGLMSPWRTVTVRVLA